MDLKFLDFEQPIAELEAKIEELRFVGNDSEVNISDEIARLKAKSESLTTSIFANLSRNYLPPMCLTNKLALCCFPTTRPNTYENVAWRLRGSKWTLLIKSRLILWGRPIRYPRIFL